MSLTLRMEDLFDLQQPTQTLLADGLSDTTYEARYGGLTHTRRVLTLGKGLFIAHTTIQTEKELVLLGDNPHAGMEMHFNLAGAAYAQLGGQRVGFTGAQHNQLFFAGFHNAIHYAPGRPYACLEIDSWPLTDLRDHLAYRPDDLEEQLAQVEAGRTFALGQPRPLLPAQRLLLHELLTCPLTGAYRRIYLEAKVWELYALQAGQFSGTPAETSKLSATELEKLHFVGELLAGSLSSPASLLDYSRLAGLNLDKLKRGFKEAFGTTVFGYLHQLRMQRAHELLADGTQPVAEVATLVGYRNPQHFTAAFKKRYGYLPSTLRR